MTNPVKEIPRGFGYSGGQSVSLIAFQTVDGDSEVNAIWNEYCGPEAKVYTMAFRDRVFKAAVRLFGTAAWFQQQDQNTYAVDYNYEFIVDTVRYIASGKRRFAVTAWKHLLDPSGKNNYVDVRERHEVADALREFSQRLSLTEVLKAWCSHDKGFDDLVFSLHILFGTSTVRAD